MRNILHSHIILVHRVETPILPLIRPCQYHTAAFSSGVNGLVLINCLGPGVPSSAIYRVITSYQDSPLEIVLHVQNNTALKERLAVVALPQIRTFPVLISGGYHAQVRLFLPPGLREDEITRYPLILFVYTAPGTQLVTDKWRIDMNTYLAGTKDYIVAQIDGRGSSGQGYRLQHEVYRRLGTVEVSDQLEVTEYLRDHLHFVDKRRVGIWGWSYGGYAAAMALANPMALFQCGVSVAPVVSWRLYGEFFCGILLLEWWLMLLESRLCLHGALHELPECDGQLQGLRGGRSHQLCGSVEGQAVPAHSGHR